MPALSNLKTELGDISVWQVLRVWDRILREINYWPIFKIALALLAEVRPKIVHSILNRWTAVALES